MTKVDGTWKGVYFDDRLGWITGTIEITRTGQIDQDRCEILGATVTYEHPKGGARRFRASSALLVHDAVAIDLPAEPEQDSWPRASSAEAADALVIGDERELEVRIGAAATSFTIEKLLRPITQIHVHVDAELGVAQGFWSQPTDLQRTDPHFARGGALDDTQSAVTGMEIWGKQSPTIAKVRTAPATAAWHHANPAVLEGAHRTRTIWISGHALPRDAIPRAIAPFHAASYRLLAGAAKEEALRALAPEDIPSLPIGSPPPLDVAAVDIFWDGEVAEGLQMLTIDGVSAPWVLTFVPWPTVLRVVRNTGSDPHWQTATEVHPGDEIRIEILTTNQSTELPDAVELQIITHGGANSIARTITAKPDGDRLATETLQLPRPDGTAAPGELLALTPNDTLLVTPRRPIAGIGVVQTRCTVPDEELWNRYVQRVAAAHAVPPDNDKKPVGSLGGVFSSVDVTLRDATALVLLRDTLRELTDAHRTLVEQFSPQQWEGFAGHIVKGTAKTKGRTPFTGMEVPDHYGRSIPFELVFRDPFGPMPNALGWAWQRQFNGSDARVRALELARERYLENVRASIEAMDAAGDEDLDKLIKFAPVAHGQVGALVQLRLLRWSAADGRYHLPNYTRAIVGSIGELAEAAGAAEEYSNLVWTAIAAAGTVLLGAAALAFAAYGLKAAAIGTLAAGTALDVGILAFVEVPEWRNEDFAVEVMTGGYAIVGAPAYQQALEAQTSMVMRVISVAGVVLGPLLDGFDLAAKLAKTNRALGESVARAVTASGAAAIDTIRQLPWKERLAFFGYIERAVLAVGTQDDLARAALVVTEQLRNVDPKLLARNVSRRALRDIATLDTHTLKFAGSAGCVFCSRCLSLRALFQPELEASAAALDDLRVIEARVAAIMEEGRGFDVMNPKHVEVQEEAKRLFEQLVEASRRTAPSVVSTPPHLLRQGLSEAGRRVVNELASSDPHLYTAVAQLHAAGRGRLAAAVIEDLGRVVPESAANNAGRTMLEVLSPEGRAGLVKLLAGGPDQALIGSRMLRHRATRKTADFKFAYYNPAATDDAFRMVGEMSDLQLQGLRRMFVGDGDQLMGGRSMADFSSRLVRWLSDNRSGDARVLVFDALDTVATLDEMTRGIGWLGANLVNAGFNTYRSAVHQIFIGTKRLREARAAGETGARLLFEVTAGNRRLDVVVLDAAGNILLECECKDYRFFAGLEKWSTVKQFAEDIVRCVQRNKDVADPLSTAKGGLRWSITGEDLIAIAKAKGKDPHEMVIGYLKTAFDPMSAEHASRSIPGAEKVLGKIRDLMKPILDDPLLTKRILDDLEKNGHKIVLLE